MNQGVAALDTELILLLNPDVELQTSVDGLEARLHRGGCGIGGRKTAGRARSRADWF